MIYTLTVSPAVDLYYEIDDFKVGEINKPKSEMFKPGGKGINVSLVLNNFGIPSIACGFIGGFSGDYIEQSLKEMGIDTRFVRCDGNTRINVKIEGNRESAINGIGTKVGLNNIDALNKILDEMGEGDILIISGAATYNIKKEYFDKILDNLKGKGIKLVLDLQDDLLLDALKYEPFMVKPNKEELEKIFGVKIKSDNDLIKYGKCLKEKGAKNVIVSLGEDGAILIGDSIIKKDALGKESKVVSTVGAGDSMVAGFVYGIDKKKSIEESFELAIAFACARVYSKNLPSKNDVLKLYKNL